MVEYDKYYIERDYFGKSCKEFIDFFDLYPKKGSVLDLGCGQGRDSIELAKLGYKVLGIDISSVGINQMLEESNKLGLNIEGKVADIYEFNQIQAFDIIVLDSMLHFYKKDKEKETKLFNKVLNDMKKHSIFCNLLLKSKKNEAYIKSLVKSNNNKFEIIFDSYARYIEADCEYHMFVVKKI